MNEVEKMYENAGVKYYKEICAIKNVIDKVGNKECYFEVCCSSCPLNKTSFTAEKQLEIVKFLLNKSIYYDTYGDREYWFHLSDEIENSKYRDFDEAIAECINKMWKDLRDYEKVQIKEILE